MPPRTPRLSKSKIIAFRQCPKRLWLEIHRPELREDSASTQAVFAIGHQVGAVARRIYDTAGTGVEIPIERDHYAEAFDSSREQLAAHDHPVFEAGFETNGTLAFADVMLPQTCSAGWKMVEVKSSTSVKDYHREDAAVQTYIAQQSGVQIEAVALACIDTAWIYPGGGDYLGLLYETDLTEEVLGRMQEVEGWIAQAKLVASSPTPPEIEPGPQCNNPFECGFCAHCNEGRPQPEMPVSWLPRIAAQKCEKFAQEGITELADVPDVEINAIQQRVKEHTLADTVYFDAVGAAADLAPYGFPAYFLDFETINFAVPIWAGTRPYQQVPFQFSLHIVGRNRSVQHRSFLDLSGQDPAEPFAQALIEDCGTQGPVFVYNETFEASRIRELIERFPRLAKELRAILKRIVDLLPVARERYYHPSMHGSWSIKAVLPAAVPELSYESLEGVRDGGAAMAVFAEALRPTTTAERKAEIERQLQAYCGLDTMAMVRLCVSGHLKPATHGRNRTSHPKSRNSHFFSNKLHA